MSIPLIDLGPFRGAPDDPTVRAALAADVDAAARDLGFLAIVGHGVDPTVVATAQAAARAFFELPEEQRMAVAPPAPGYPYGYSAFRAEALNRSIGGAAPPDLKETFNVGPIDAPPRSLDEMDDPDERAVYAPNLWPDRPPAFRTAIERYYRTMAELADLVLRAFALALGLDERWFEPFTDRHGSALRLAHYPALPPGTDPTLLRAGAHTDYGTLTILWVDGIAGLEVEAAPGRWLPVEVPADAFVVNLGDLMQRWTNDRWRSTMHRVTAAEPSRDRLSMPFFHNANWDARVECITAPGEPPRHRPVRAGAHLMAKFRSTVA